MSLSLASVPSCTPGSDTNASAAAHAVVDEVRLAAFTNRAIVRVVAQSAIGQRVASKAAGVDGRRRVATAPEAILRTFTSDAELTCGAVLGSVALIEAKRRLTQRRFVVIACWIERRMGHATRTAASAIREATGQAGLPRLTPGTATGEACPAVVGTAGSHESFDTRRIAPRP